MAESPRTSADRKLRFGGILENPTISKVQRAVLDGGRVRGLRHGLKGIEYERILDIGCGLGECSGVLRAEGRYVGVDNSFSRIAYAQARYPAHTFLVGDALSIPFADQSFDAVMLIDTSHHLTDEQFRRALTELKRLSRKFIIVSDPLVYAGQNSLSKFFYSLDRGACFRSEDQSRKILQTVPGLRCIGTFSYRTFPGLYIHQAFILQVGSGGTF